MLPSTLHCWLCQWFGKSPKKFWGIFFATVCTVSIRLDTPGPFMSCQLQYGFQLRFSRENISSLYLPVVFSHNKRHFVDNLLAAETKWKSYDKHTVILTFQLSKMAGKYTQFTPGANSTV